jgi:hypothetical protein
VTPPAATRRAAALFGSVAAGSGRPGEPGPGAVGAVRGGARAGGTAPAIAGLPAITTAADAATARPTRITGRLKRTFGRVTFPRETAPWTDAHQ